MKRSALALTRSGIATCVVLASVGARACAQDEPWERTLDILGGETLYEDGWLFTSGYNATRRAGLLRHDDRVGDPNHAEQLEQALTLAAHYGFLHDVQVGIVLPYAFHSIRRENGPGPSRLASEGPGDVSLFGKWAFLEDYEPHMNLKASLIGGIKFPTGSDHASDGGARLPADLQPGTGAWDGVAGAAINYEPYRWKFDATVLYKRNGENDDHFHFGNETYVELAAGNRFYLEPYPGPFMRFDLELLYRHFDRDRVGANVVDDSGRDLISVGGRYVFRPRPSIDTQLEVEIPVYQRVGGVQLAEKFSVFAVFAVRI